MSIVSGKGVFCRSSGNGGPRTLAEAGLAEAGSSGEFCDIVPMLSGSCHDADQVSRRLEPSSSLLDTRGGEGRKKSTF